MRKLAAVVVTLFSVCTSIAGDKPQYWDGGFKAVNVQLEKNLRAPSRINPFWHVHPAPKYPGVYLWDSSFISLIWKHRNPLIAQDIIRSVLYNQKPDGRIPQVVSITGPSPLSNPPVLSYAAEDILELTHDVKFATDVYQKLLSFHDWLFRERRLGNGLGFWAKPYESGLDNSPRFSNRDESQTLDTTILGAVDMTSYLILDCRSLVKMTRFLEEYSDLDKTILEANIKTLERQATQTTSALNKYLWNEKDGYYYDLDITTGKQNGIASVVTFFPLVAHASSVKQFLRLREHAVNQKEFNTVFPFPSISQADKTFEKDTWRGPVWINTSFLAIRGLKEYGDVATAKYFSQNLVDSVYRVWSEKGSFYEFYDPNRYDFTELSRKKGLGFLGLSASHNPLEVLEQLFLKRLILGNKPVSHFVGWTGLVNTLAIEELGWQPDQAAK